MTLQTARKLYEKHLQRVATDRYDKYVYKYNKCTYKERRAMPI